MPTTSHATAITAALALAATASAQCDPSTIYPPISPTYGAGNGPASIAIADLDDDGAPDLAVANEFSDDVSVLLGSGDGTFQTEHRFGVGDRPKSVAIGDMDADGTPDLAVLNFSTGDVSVLLGNGDGTFQPGQRFDVTPFEESLAIGDLDADGAPDLAVPSSNGVSVLLGNGDGTFQPRQVFDAGLGPRSVAISDLDADGALDLAVTNIDSQDVSVLLGNGDGTFQAEQRFSAGDLPLSVAIGDLDADGDLDLAVANGVDDVSVLLGSGDGTFPFELRFSVGVRPESIAIGDLDGDGVLDLATANAGTFSNPISDVSVLLGSGDGTFQPERSFDTGNAPMSVAIADLDTDGTLDLAVANNDSDDVSVLVNQCVVAPSISQQPAGMTLVDAGTDITLSVDVFIGTPPLSFQWRKNDAPLADDGRILGAQTDTLTISNANPGDTDTYTVVVTNAVGTITSNQAVLSVRDTCPTDTDNNGTTDLNDLLAVLSNFGDPCP